MPRKNPKCTINLTRAQVDYLLELVLDDREETNLTQQEHQHASNITTKLEMAGAEFEAMEDNDDD